MRLVNLCLGTCYFQFNNRVYQQKNSLAMGNPLSAFAANCFMSQLETKAKEDYPNFPSIWYRYVDDTFTIIDKDNVVDFLRYLNSINPTIKFTMETEENESIAFLDLKLTRIDGKIDFNVYRKETSTDRCIPNNSYHSKQTKLASFNSFCYRAINFPLSENNFIEERKKLHTIARVNG